MHRSHHFSREYILHIQSVKLAKGRKIPTRYTVYIFCSFFSNILNTRVGTLIVATIYLQLIQNRYMFRSFTVLHCSHQHCVQPVVSDVEVVGYL